MDYSLIITAKNEPKTVAKLIGQIEDQMPRLTKNFEILVVCPDEMTKESAISQDKLQVVSWIKDKAEGKPAALNLAFNEAKGDILILTDGDVSLAEGALENLVGKIVGMDPSVRPKQGQTRGSVPTNKIGLVTGRPIPANPRDDLFGFWAHFLTQAAHYQRDYRDKNNFYLDGSGYLMAVKKELVSPMPKNILVDDAWLSRQVWDQGLRIGYAPEAKVKVKFPTNLSDWVIQKKRTTSGYVQLSSVDNADSPCCEAGLRSLQSMRGFFQEAKGLRLSLTYPRNLKEYFWMLLLIFARLYVWLAVYWERRILKKPYSGNWKRIESTK